MKRFLDIGIEEIKEEFIPSITDAEVEESVSKSNDEDADLQQNIDIIEDADNILETTNTIEKSIEVSVQNEEGLDKVSAEVATAALEHFYQKFNFKVKKSISISTENFQSKETCLDSTKIILENLQTFNTKLDKHLTIAKEGLIKRFSNSIKMIFTAEKKIIAKITDDLSKVKSSGVKEEEVINEPGWGRSFASIDSKVISGSHVIKYLSTLDKLFKNDMRKYIEEINNILTRITSELKRGSTKESVEKAYKELINIVQDIEKFDKNFQDNYSNLKTQKTDPDFNTLTISEVNTLGNLALGILKDDKIEKDFDEFFSIVWNNFSEIWNHSEFRTDIATSMANTSSERISNVIDVFWDMLAERKRICFAASNYIKASLK